jgi:recombination protein RecA
MSPESRTNLDIICAEIDKKYGKGTVQKFNDIVPYDKENTTSSGSIGLDMALGVGGYPDGRIIEIYGPESGGKTTLCLHAVANAQARGKNCLYVDAENSLDARYASSLNVDMDKLIISQPDFGEQALDIVDTFVRSGEIGLIIIDSVSALVPKAELEGEMADQQVGLQARMMSKALRKITAQCNHTKCTVIFINQLRSKIGVMYGSNEVTSGGNSLKYYASQRLDIRRIGDIKKGDDVTGNKTRVRVVKNKMAPPKKEVEFSIMFGKGIDTDQEIVDLALIDNIITKAGAWYKYNNESIGQGSQNVILYLNENSEIKEKIVKEIKSNRGLD